MKFQDAKNLINEGEKHKPFSSIKRSEAGYMVSFDHHVGGLLHGKHFPDKHAGEALIKNEEDAWELAERFAKATDTDYVNIYVINHTFSPVAGYANKKLKSYP